MAARLTAGACDHVRGAFDVVWSRTWTTGDVQEQIQWDNHELGDAVMVTRHPSASTRAVTRWWYQPLWSSPIHSGRPVPVRNHTPHQSPARLRLELAHDPTEFDNRHISAASAVRNLGRLADRYVPDRAARRTALTMIADLPDLVIYPSVTDRAGRTGTGLAATDHTGRRHLLILCPDTGEPLAYEETTPQSAGGKVDTYTLYLTHTHATRRFWELDDNTPDPAPITRGLPTPALPAMPRRPPPVPDLDAEPEP